MNNTYLVALIIFLVIILWAQSFQKGKYFPAIAIGFAIRLALIYFEGKSGLLFNGDDLPEYTNLFNRFEDALQSNDLRSFLQLHTPVYAVLYPGWLYVYLGINSLWIIRLVNAAISLFTLAPLAWLNQIVFGRSLSVNQALIITLWPTWMRYSIELGRSAPTVFFTILGITGILATFSHPKFRLHLFSLAGIALSFGLRTHYIAYFASMISFSIWSKRNELRDRNLKPIIYFVLAASIIVLIFFLVSIYQNYGKELYRIESLQEIEELADKREKGGSVYLADFDLRGPLDLIWYLPIHAFYFMFSPMPWDVQSLFAAGSSLQAWTLLVALFISLRKQGKNWFLNRNLSIIFSALIVSAIVFGSATKNAGGAERWRLPSTLVLITITTSLLKQSSVKHTVYRDTKHLLNRY